MVNVTGCVIDCETLDLPKILDTVRAQLAKAGIEFESCCTLAADSAAEGEEPSDGADGANGAGGAGGAAARSKVKVVCVAPDLQQAVQELCGCSRDRVVMVRVDQETTTKLDTWVETGAVKSRSEAAALFIREGLKVRESELERLGDVLQSYNEAKDRLRREARDAFGLDGDEKK